uniref:Uncharacterized protein LOC111105631 isoform X2 n=1 Tax=Crassostrea virginica TaxID=6565 RepID=A0A8B8AX54_CRAVI|nr:uncharacterized protein LOC111105631 isoform X2 [Crassostrea virginica]
MKSFLRVFSIYGAFLSFTKTKGVCPIWGTSETYTMRRCDGSYKSGRNVFVDFYQIKQPCTCTLKASFSGNLLVTVMSDGYDDCRIEVIVSLGTTSSVFNCRSIFPSSVVFTVVNNKTVVNVKAEYIQSYTSWDFPVCLQINENEMKTNTNHVSDKITNRPISTNISTPKCTSASDANNLALQMTLACFVVISVVLAVLSVYLYIQLNFRIQSMNEEGNDSQRTRSETITDNYTELGLENVTAEPENQYESLARQENYTNLNMV